MNKFVSTAFTWVLIVAVSKPAFAQESWAEVLPGSQLPPSEPSSLTAPEAPQGGLTFFNDRAVFTATGAVLVTENFDGSLIGPAEVCSWTAPLNSLTNDSCFATGGVVAGQELDIIVSGGGGNYVILTSGFLGVSTDAVGPSSFVDDAVFNFNPPVTAVGFDVIGDLTGSVNLNVEIFDDNGNSLGITTASGSNPGTFFGVTSSIPIGRIETVEPNGNGELFSDLVFGNLSFGPPPVVPTLGQLSLLLLSLVMAGFAVIFIRR